MYILDSGPVSVCTDLNVAKTLAVFTPEHQMAKLNK